MNWLQYVVSYYSNKNLHKILKQIPKEYKIIITENSLNLNLKGKSNTIIKMSRF